MSLFHPDQPEADLILERVARIEAARAARPRIDYDRMNELHPVQKRRLTAAVKQGRDAVLVECARTVKEWDEIGCWPDDWSHWQRTLDDQFPVFHAPRLEDLR